jgi:hypothetical protein
MLAGNYKLYVSYKYMDYRLEYEMSRLIPKTDWIYKEDDNLIQLKPNEVLNQRLTNKDEDAKLYYQINYRYVDESRDDIIDLVPYFTPVLKDYTLKVQTKESVI